MRCLGVAAKRIIGERVSTELVPVEQVRSSGFNIETDELFVERSLIKQGNRDVSGVDFSWIIDSYITDFRYPETLMTIERREWGNFYGYLKTV